MLFKKKEKKSPEAIEAEKRKKSFQERLQIAKIQNRLFVSKRGEFYPAFMLGQKSIELMSDEEAYEFSKQLEIVFETIGIVTSQFLMLPVPFDLAPYQDYQYHRYSNLRAEEAELRSKLAAATSEEQVNVISEQLSQNLVYQKYIDDQSYFVARNMQSGRVANKNIYVICKIKECYNETAVQEASKAIEETLKTLSEDSHRCSEAEMEKILIELFNPLRPEIYINA